MDGNNNNMNQQQGQPGAGFPMAGAPLLFLAHMHQLQGSNFNNMMQNNGQQQQQVTPQMQLLMMLHQQQIQQQQAQHQQQPQPQQPQGVPQTALSQLQMLMQQTMPQQQQQQQQQQTNMGGDAETIKAQVEEIERHSRESLNMFMQALQTVQAQPETMKQLTKPLDGPLNETKAALNKLASSSSSASLKRSPSSQNMPPQLTMKKTSHVRDTTKRRRCETPDCGRLARGSRHCAKHGGGVRCESEGCDRMGRLLGFCYEHVPEPMLENCLSREPNLENDVQHFAWLPLKPDTKDLEVGVMSKFRFSELKEKLGSVKTRPTEPLEDAKMLVSSDPGDRLKYYAVEVNKRDLHEFFVIYRKLLGRGLQYGLYRQGLRIVKALTTPPGPVVPTPDNPTGFVQDYPLPLEPELKDTDLMALPTGWTKQGGKIVGPGENAATYNSLQDFLNKYSPTNVIYKHCIPIQDYFYLFKESCAAAKRKQWQATLETRDIDTIRNHNFELRLTDYRKCKILFSLNGLRYKYDANRFFLACMPMIVTYSHQDNAAIFRADIKLTTIVNAPPDFRKLARVTGSKDKDK